MVKRGRIFPPALFVSGANKMTIGISRGELITASSAPDFAVTDDLTVADAADVGGVLTVAGAVVAQSTLDVTGDTTLTGKLTMGGSAAGDLIVKGAAANKLIETDASADKIGFFAATPIVKPAALTTQLTSITHTAPGTPDYALQDLVQNTGFGFVTKDEGNTVLKVILNLQVRLAEAEAKLQALGLLS